MTVVKVVRVKRTSLICSVCSCDRSTAHTVQIEHIGFAPLFFSTSAELLLFFSSLVLLLLLMLPTNNTERFLSQCLRTKNREERVQNTRNETFQFPPACWSSRAVAPTSRGLTCFELIFAHLLTAVTDCIHADITLPFCDCHCHRMWHTPTHARSVKGRRRRADGSQFVSYHCSYTSTRESVKFYGIVRSPNQQTKRESLSTASS